jgi:hypothetical protein
MFSAMSSETVVCMSPIMIDLSLVFFGADVFGVDLWASIWVSFLGSTNLYAVRINFFEKYYQS